MAAPIQYRLISGKDGRYHLDICRKILRHVAEQAPTQRRFALWLRDNGVKDRDLLEFLVRVLDVKIAKKTTLGEVGEELLEAARARPAVRTMTVGGPGQPAPPAQDTSTDPDALQKALFERFVELDGYLLKYVYEQIAEAGGFLSGAEMVTRVGRAAYVGERPTKENFDRWLQWMRFLGQLRQVGMRYTHTDAGADGLGYLRSLDDEDLLGGQGALGLLSGLTEKEEEATDSAIGIEDAGGPPPKPYLTAEEAAAQAGGPAAALPPMPLPGLAMPSSLPSASLGGGTGDLDEELLEEFDDADFGPQHAPPQADADLDRAFGLDVLALPAPRAASAAAAPPPSEEPAPLSEEEEDAIREFLGDAALAELQPVGPPAAGEGLELDALDNELAALTRDVDAIGTGDEEDTSEAETQTFPAAAPVGADRHDTPEAPVSAEDREDAAETEGEEAGDEDDDREADGDENDEPAADGEAPPTRVPEPAPTPPPAARATARRPAAGTRGVAKATAAAPSAAAPSAPASRGTDSDLIARIWETEAGRRPLTANDLGLHAEHASARSRPFDLFRLATAAILMEADGEAATKLGIYDRLARSKALENILFVGWTLEQVLEASGLAAVETALPRAAERLIHLPRLKTGLCEIAAIRGLLASDAAQRPGAITRRSGYALLRGAYWVDREMRRLGHWK